MNSTLETLAIIIAIGGFSFTLGKALDLYLLKKHKGKLHGWLEKWWFWLEEKRVPDFIPTVAKHTISFIHFLFGNKLFSWKFLTRSVSFSFILTTHAMILGRILTFKPQDETSISYESIWLVYDILMFFIINYAYDFATCIITLWALHKLSQKQSFSSRLFVIATDFFLALLFAFMVVPTLSLLLIYIQPNYYFRDGFLDPFVHWVCDIMCFGDIRSSSECLERIDKILPLIFYSATTLTPTLFYLSFILFLIISKYTLIFTKWITGGFLLRAVDDEPNKLKVFTLTGTLLGVLAGLAKLVEFFLTDWG